MLHWFSFQGVFRRHLGQNNCVKFLCVYIYFSVPDFISAVYFICEEWISELFVICNRK